MSGVKSKDTEAELEGMLRLDPFSSLNVHFGMLLGVEDFRTVDAYHRGKMWLHSAWLHRQGTIWGLAVATDKASSEVRVSPGLAVDGLGRELYLGAPACLSLPAWYEAHKDDHELVDIEPNEDGDVIFDAHVAIRFKACLSRQVPALSEPCDGANSTTAYSRIEETLEICLRPGPAPEWRAPAGSLPFHRVRLLFALEDAIEKEGAVIADDQEVLDARLEVLSLPSEQQPATYLKWFRYFSAKDEMEQRPVGDDEGSQLFPVESPDWIPLANLSGIQLIPAEDGGWKLYQVSDLDNTVRPVHLPTSTIQELVNGPLFSALTTPTEATPAEADDAVPKDAGGPRIDPATVESKGEIIRLKIDGPTLMKASVDERVIQLTSFDVRDGWIEEVIKKVSFNSNSKIMEIELRDDPGGRLVRLIVKGTGPTPLLGRNRIPLAGSIGGIPGSLDNGVDFITMFRAES